MLDTEYKQILNEVLDENKYLCLSTSDIEGNPWASPLVYVRDADYNFYFLSHTLSRHCKNIEKNNKVAFSVFNSKQNVGIAFWVQASGIATQIQDIPLEIKETLFKEVAAAVTCHEYAFYKIVTTEIFLPDEHRWEKDGNIRKSIKIR